MSYKDLRIHQEAQRLAIAVHHMSLQLPRHEMFEQGSQIRRSAKSVPACIVEGFGRREYKQDYIKFLIYAQASSDETKEHLEILFDTGSLNDEKQYRQLLEGYEQLGRSLHMFIKSLRS